MAASCSMRTSLEYPKVRPKFVKEGAVEEKYLCICDNHVLMPPVKQLTCGHRICTDCHEGLLKDEKDQDSGYHEPRCCPGGEEECEDASIHEVFPDKGTNKELLKMQVQCINQQYGCGVTIDWSKLDEHLKSCKCKKVQCTNTGCAHECLEQDLPQHLQNECKFSPSLCEFCNEMIPKVDLDNGHEKQCQQNERPCKMATLGCPQNGYSMEMINHESDIKGHNDVMYKALMQIQDQMKQMGNEINSLKNQNRELGTRVEELSKENKALSEYSKSTASKLESFGKALAGNFEKSVVNDKQIADSIESLKSEQAKNFNLIMIHDGRLSNIEQNQSTTPTENASSLERSMHMLETKMAENDIRFRCLETAFHKGELLWKITNYSRRRQDAKDGRVLSLYSQPFYSDDHGYKMCARIYLNGDGLGKGSHISLFFVVMRGDYDALLQWPFRKRISLSIVDQLTGQSHITDSFRPDPTSSSFRRPVNDMNIASGCPMFAEQSVVNTDKYIRDDTLFVRIKVFES